MISVIAGQGARTYLGAMASALLRLLMLASLLLMPAGMASAPALAAPAPASAGHCDEHQKPVDTSTKQQVHCTACTALPAIEAPEAATGMLPEASRLLALIQPISGIEPEITTPPPRLS